MSKNINVNLDPIHKLIYDNHQNIFGKSVTKQAVEGLSDSMNNSGVPHYTNVANLINDINSSDGRSAAIDSLKLIHGMTSIVASKTIPGGNGLTALSLFNNIDKIRKEL